MNQKEQANLRQLFKYKKIIADQSIKKSSGFGLMLTQYELIGIVNFSQTKCTLNRSRENEKSRMGGLRFKSVRNRGTIMSFTICDFKNYKFKNPNLACYQVISSNLHFTESFLSCNQIDSHPLTVRQMAFQKPPFK